MMSPAPADRGSSFISTLTSFPWHPTLFAVTVVLAYWVETVVSPYAAVRSILVAIGLGVALTGVVWLLVRDRARAGLIATAVFLLLYSKHLVSLMGDLAERAPAWAFVAWLVALLLAALLLFRTVRRVARRWSAHRLNVLLNLVSFVYLASTIAMAFLGGRVGQWIADLSQGMTLAQAAAADAGDARGPDVYLILLDGYPRADVLDEAFGFDNSDFVQAVQDRGFEVATNSMSDYLWTQQSLTSMLHMRRVEEIDEFMSILSRETPRQPHLRNLVNDSPVLREAREHGLRVVATGYEFEELALRQADVYVDPGYLNEFELQLLVSTYLGDLVGLLSPDFASSQHRAWITFQTDALPQVARQVPGPKLVIGHIPAPHQPAVFGADGEPVAVRMDRHFYADSPPERGISEEAFADGYRAQLAYLNRRFLAMVDGILEASDEPPVIVLWSDHGSASRVDWTVTSADDADPAALRERTSTLFAALTPGHENVFPDDITPKEIFDHLADAYLESGDE